MDAITIPVEVGADRRLVIDLPASTPLGPADVVIVPRGHGTPESTNTARAKARAKLLAAGFLSTDIPVPEGAAPLSDDDIARIGQLAKGARSSEDLVSEDREPY